MKTFCTKNQIKSGYSSKFNQVTTPFIPPKVQNRIIITPERETADLQNDQHLN